MSTSFQAIPPPPGAVYQAGESNPATTPYHSNGSYTTVFIVLAMIFAVSVVSCVLNRLCEKRSSGQPKTKKSKNDHGHGQAHNKARYSDDRSKERDVELGFGPKGADIEIGGFDRKIPKVKFAPNGHGHGHGHGRGPHPHGCGHGKQGQSPPQNWSGSGQYGGGPMGHRLLPMMECPRNF